MSEVFRPDYAGCGRARRGARRRRVALLLAAALLGSVAAHGKCTIQRLPPIPVTMAGAVPLVDAEINGSRALFVADSGAFFSVITPATVHQFNLSVDASQDTTVTVGSKVQISHVAWVKSFTIMGQTLSKVPFIVVDMPIVHAAGILGQNFFRIDDVEYDLANGIIRLVRTKDCRGSSLAYWADAAGKPYSEMDIELATAEAPYTRGVAYLNGAKISVVFDTGSNRSLLTLAAAKRAGITPQSEGVRPANSPRTWIARFASFSIGDETIEHAQLRFGDFDRPGTDMLIGGDFFLSHRIYVASSQHKVYFTYNGGPVFDLDAPRTPDSGAAASASSGAPADTRAETAPPPVVDGRLDRPTDAAGFSRRALASAARHDIASAISDLDHACELAPSVAAYHYQRGFLHWQNKQPDLALADFDRAIEVNPDEVDSRIMRASIRLRRHDSAGATEDLVAADRVAPRNSDARPSIADVYYSLGNLPAAREQLSMWIDTHPSDARMPEMLHARCWYAGLNGEALEQALADCNLALKLRPKSAQYLDSRGLVHLRRGDFDQAIADYDAALSIQPRLAWSLYGRGLAKLRKGQRAAGQADLQAATALAPRIAAQAARHGLSP